MNKVGTMAGHRSDSLGFPYGIRTSWPPIPESPGLVESEGMRDTSVGLLGREERLERYSRLEAGLPISPIDPARSVAGIAWLYDLLPKASRNRPVDASGVAELHRCLAVLDSDAVS